jgi:hypothetical protein
MKKNTGFFKKKGSWIYILVLVIVVGVAVMIASLKPVPTRVITEYPMSMLVEEAQYMHDCAECHETDEFHMCDTCHNEHGSADLANLNFYSVLHVTGDVPEEQYFSIYQMFSKRNEESNKINVLDFLRDLGVEDFENVTFCTNDGGFSTITAENLGETSYLLPYEEGMRFADEALHVSTWLKGVNKIIVATGEENIRVNGQGYSFGALLLNDTVQFTVEQASVMLANDELDTMKTGTTATRLEGVELEALADIDTSSNVTITLEDGSTQTISSEEALNSKLVLIGENIVLVFPEKGRSQWIEGVSSIEVN